MSPVQVLRQFPLPPRSKVGDFGTGAGHYALALAERMGPEGSIYAIDAFGPGLDAVRREAARHRASLYTLQSDLNEHIPLKTDLLDAAVVVNILHQLSDRARFVSELGRVMIAGGRALVIDWAGSFRNMGPPGHAVLSPGETAGLFRSAGFSTDETVSAGTHHFAFVATKLEGS